MGGMFTVKYVDILFEQTDQMTQAHFVTGAVTVLPPPSLSPTPSVEPDPSVFQPSCTPRLG